MALLEVERVSGGYTEHLHPFEVVIDNEVVGLLGAGEVWTVELAAGCHEIFVRIYWCRSEKVDVEVDDQEELAFRCETRANLFTDGYWATLGRARYLRLEQIQADGRRSPRASSTGSLSAAGDEASLRPRRLGVPLFLLGVAAFLSLAVDQGFTFLAGIAAISIAVQGVIAINFFFLSPRFGAIRGGRSHEPFRFRIAEEVFVSCLFAIAGPASIVGIVDQGSLAGWLALAAAATGFLNVVVTRTSLATER
jgi:hypothetical protein